MKPVHVQIDLRDLVALRKQAETLQKNLDQISRELYEAKVDQEYYREKTIDRYRDGDGYLGKDVTKFLRSIAETPAASNLLKETAERLWERLIELLPPEMEAAQ